LLSSLLITAAFLSQTPEWETDIGYLPFSSPLLASNGEGSMDIFIAMGDQGLGGWSGEGLELPGFPVSAESGVSRRPAALTAPVDGPVIVYADNDGLVHMVDHSGRERPGWPVDAGYPVSTGISIVNLDEDCSMEITFGTSDGSVHMLGLSGRSAEGWPVRLPARMQWQPSQLSLGGNSGYGLICGLVTKNIYVLSADGSVLPGWPVSTGFTLGSVPVSADIDADGLGDVVLATNNDRVYALDLSGGTIEGWPFFLDDRVSGGAVAIGHLSTTSGGLQVAVSTVDGNVTLIKGSGKIAGTWRWPNLTAGLPASPVIVPADGGPSVITGCDSGYVYAWNAQGDAVPGYPAPFGQPVSRTPAAGDIDGDGRLEIVVLGRSGKLAAFSLNGLSEGEAYWPQILCDQHNSGSYGTSYLPVAVAGYVASEASGSVSLPYEITSGSASSISLAYSTNAGFSWTETSSFRDSGNSLAWWSDTDLPGTDAGECALKVTPMCPEGPGISGISNVFHLDNNQPPSLYISAVEEESDGRYLIFYSVEDRESDIIQLQAQYSTDGGSSWNSARLTGSTMQIPSWLYGDPVRWNSLGEPGIDGPAAPILRMRAADADPGPWSVAELDSGPTDASVAQIIAPVEEVSGRVRLGVRLADPKEDPLSYDWEYSLDGGDSWEEASVTDPSVPTTGSYHYDLIWDSSRDIPGLDAGSVRLRALARGRDRGSSVSSSPFHVDNNTPPSLSVTSPGRWDHFRGSVPVSFNISDAEGDSISMLLQYRIEGTSAWTPASGLIPSGYYPHSTYSSSLVWNSGEDLPGTRRLEMRIRIGATDGDTVFTDEIGPISIDNSRLPAVMQAALRELSPQAGEAVVSYELSDPGERVMDLMVTYSTDGGTTWRDASVEGDVFGRNAGTYQGSFRWDYEGDVGGDVPIALLKMTPVSGDLLGIPKILEVDLR